MPLVKTDKFTPSKTLYAVLWETFETDLTVAGSKLATVSYVAASRKSGVQQLTAGLLSTYLQSPTPESFMKTVTASHGPHAQVRWDGEYMWAPNLSLAEMNGWAAKLDPLLENLPAVPAGAEGWYLLTSS